MKEILALKQCVENNVFQKKYEDHRSTDEKVTFDAMRSFVVDTLTSYLFNQKIPPEHFREKRDFLFSKVRFEKGFYNFYAELFLNACIHIDSLTPENSDNITVLPVQHHNANKIENNVYDLRAKKDIDDK